MQFLILLFVRRIDAILEHCNARRLLSWQLLPLQRLTKLSFDCLLLRMERSKCGLISVVVNVKFYPNALFVCADRGTNNKSRPPDGKGKPVVFVFAPDAERGTLVFAFLFHGPHSFGLPPLAMTADLRALRPWF
jgi:hypothetical protein